MDKNQCISEIDSIANLRRIGQVSAAWRSIIAFLESEKIDDIFVMGLAVTELINIAMRDGEKIDLIDEIGTAWESDFRQNRRVPIVATGLLGLAVLSGRKLNLTIEEVCNANSSVAINLLPHLHLSVSEMHRFFNDSFVPAGNARYQRLRSLVHQKEARFRNVIIESEISTFDSQVQYFENKLGESGYSRAERPETQSIRTSLKTLISQD